MMLIPAINSNHRTFRDSINALITSEKVRLGGTGVAGSTGALTSRATAGKTSAVGTGVDCPGTVSCSLT